jgi:hypothetical protein
MYMKESGMRIKTNIDTILDSRVKLSGMHHGDGHFTKTCPCGQENPVTPRMKYSEGGRRTPPGGGLEILATFAGALGDKGNIYITLASCSINRDASASCLLEAPFIVACIGEVRPRPTWNPPRAVPVFGKCRHFQDRASGVSTRLLFSVIRKCPHGILAGKQRQADKQQTETGQTVRTRPAKRA